LLPWLGQITKTGSTILEILEISSKSKIHLKLPTRLGAKSGPTSRLALIQVMIRYFLLHSILCPYRWNWIFYLVTAAFHPGELVEAKKNRKVLKESV
jgi:hypothetical protein